MSTLKDTEIWEQEWSMSIVQESVITQAHNQIVNQNKLFDIYQALRNKHSLIIRMIVQ